jgi:hypothetical protein
VRRDGHADRLRKNELALVIQKLGHLRSALLMVRFTTAIIAWHIVEIMLWAGFYRALCFPLWESAFYFSAASYATVGYEDVILPQLWRTLGFLESIMGVVTPVASGTRHEQPNYC